VRRGFYAAMANDYSPRAFAAGERFQTDLPRRLDRLPWTRFHTLIVAALGITWILDGLEVTLGGSVAGILRTPAGLSMSDAEIGVAASFYLTGAVLGALLFGYLTDKIGRRPLFFITLGLYLAATALTALSWNGETYMFFRFLTGAGIGGEYAAINSAIQEFIPARFRGRTDIGVNGSYWLGAAVGAAATLYLLDPTEVSPGYGWRVAFGIGAVLGLGVLGLRRFVPESPRWLMIHGRMPEAEKIMEGIEAYAAGNLPPPSGGFLTMRARSHSSLGEMALALLRTYPKRTLVGLTLMAAQAFFYNAIFFTYALVLVRFFGVEPGRVGLFLLPFALANAGGALLLGPLFDLIGRKRMIAATYALSGLLLGAGGWLFVQGRLDATSMTLVWTAVFFFASPAASSAYLTVSESFPLEMRALAIALFYAFGTALGGIAAPALFGSLIGTGNRDLVYLGYLVASGLMIGAAIVEAIIGISAERRALEDVAAPLAAD